MKKMLFLAAFTASGLLNASQNGASGWTPSYSQNSSSYNSIVANPPKPTPNHTVTPTQEWLKKEDERIDRENELLKRKK